MKYKFEVYNLFFTFKTPVENLFNCKIKMFQSDDGCEFDQLSKHDLFFKHGIYFRKSCPNHSKRMG